MTLDRQFLYLAQKAQVTKKKLYFMKIKTPIPQTKPSMKKKEKEKKEPRKGRKYLQLHT